MDFSNRVKQLREHAGMTQAEVAEKLGLTNRAVGAWESGRAKPRLDKMKELADLFNIPVTELMGESATEAPMAGAPTGLVPLVATSHMGERADDEEPDRTVPVPQEVIDRHPGCFAVRAEGGCMDKRYPHDCVIVIDPDAEPRVGDAVMARFPDGRSVVRAYMPGSSVLMLSPDSWSGEYEDIIVRADDDPVELAGVAVWYQAARDERRVQIVDEW